MILFRVKLPAYSLSFTDFWTGAVQVSKSEINSSIIKWQIRRYCFNAFQISLSNKGATSNLEFKNLC